MHRAEGVVPQFWLPLFANCSKAKNEVINIW